MFVYLTIFTNVLWKHRCDALLYSCCFISDWSRIPLLPHLTTQLCVFTLSRCILACFITNSSQHHYQHKKTIRTCYFYVKLWDLTLCNSVLWTYNLIWHLWVDNWYVDTRDVSCMGTLARVQMLSMSCLQFVIKIWINNFWIMF